MKPKGTNRLAPELNIVDDDISLDVHILDHVLVEPVVKVAEMFVVHCDLKNDKIKSRV